MLFLELGVLEFIGANAAVGVASGSDGWEPLRLAYPSMLGRGVRSDIPRPYGVDVLIEFFKIPLLFWRCNVFDVTEVGAVPAVTWIGVPFGSP